MPELEPIAFTATDPPVQNELEVVKVAASITFPLRRTVLGARPNEPCLEDMARPDDEDPDSGHFAVFEGERVVGTGTVRSRSAPWSTDERGFQIRGMAVAPEQRGRGIGTALLAAIVRYVEERGGGLLWCQARTGAQTLYERDGFQTYGEPFMDESSGEQVSMFRQIP